VTWSAAWTRGGKRKGACDALVAIGGGERGREREESVARWPPPFETKAGEAGEGVGVPGAVPHGRKTGQREGGRGSMTWTGTARTRRLWAALTAAGGACLAGTAVTGEAAGASDTVAAG
jgi:hypothetical protein